MPPKSKCHRNPCWIPLSSLNLPEIPSISFREIGGQNDLRKQPENLSCQSFHVATYHAHVFGGVLESLHWLDSSAVAFVTVYACWRHVLGSCIFVIRQILGMDRYQTVRMDREQFFGNEVFGRANMQDILEISEILERSEKLRVCRFWRFYINTWEVLER